MVGIIYRRGGRTNMKVVNIIIYTVLAVLMMMIIFGHIEVQKEETEIGKTNKNIERIMEVLIEMGNRHD